jgi:hypothetical protein
MDVIFRFLSFFDQFRHIIFRIPIYGFVDMNHSIPVGVVVDRPVSALVGGRAPPFLEGFDLHF